MEYQAQKREGQKIYNGSEDNPLKILLVDDSEDYALHLEDLLQEAGLCFELTYCTSAEAGISYLTEYGLSIDIALVDYILSPGTGLDVYRFIENSGLGIPCIVLSCHDDEVVEAKLFSEGIADQIHKSDLNPRLLKRSLFYAIRNRNQIERLNHLAHYDELTGLVNRRICFDRLSTVCSYYTRDGRDYSFMYIDVDHFKHINDTHGHFAGDIVLKELASRLNSLLRESDTAARVSGDEFAVILYDTYPENAKIVARKFQKAMSKPIRYLDSELYATVSVGIASLSSSGANPHNVIADADSALYVAKEDRGSVYYIGDDDDTRRYRFVHLEYQMSDAIDNGELELYYQPQYDAGSLDLVGFESLCRWNHPRYGLVSPDDFLPVIHRKCLDLKFLRKTLEMFFTNAEMLLSEFGDIRIAFNLTPTERVIESFAFEFLQMAREFHIQPHRLCVEMTEHFLMGNIKKVSRYLQKLKDAGVSIALDDFGEKHSSLNVLAQLPVDIIKMDKLFMRQVSDNEKVESILYAINNIANSLGMKVIAEGIETKAQHLVAVRTGCDEIQGFWCGKPAQISSLVRAHERFSMVACAD
ncbi:MAG: GGDEF domain-containing response regulator [Ketobacteraceae bacterium]|nr:GGDEF domain-containing response regulator [Ketobacteraceae bacterium]